MTCECWYAYFMGMLTWTAFTSGAVSAALRIVLPEKAYLATLAFTSIATIVTKLGVNYAKTVAINAYEKYTQKPLTVSSDPEHIPAAVMRKPRVVEIAHFDYSHAQHEFSPSI